MARATVDLPLPDSPTSAKRLAAADGEVEVSHGRNGWPEGAGRAVRCRRHRRC